MRHAFRCEVVYAPTLGVELVTLWGRSEFLQGERCQARIRFLRPDRSQVGEAIHYDVDLSTHPRLRHITTIPGLPIRGEGKHSFVVESLSDGTWREVAEVPLQVEVHLSSESPATPTN